MLRRFDSTLAMLATTFCFSSACFAPTSLDAAETKAAATAAEPYFHTQPLFEAGRDGYRCYRIPAIAVAPKGAILAAAAGRFNGHGDWSNTDLMLRRSTDGGQTWDEQQ